ncbi:hypothetical protein TNCV_4806811 [Trichonephila clavipes]|nr:hypothetical protein TNCV_4806811 [Trichonephila clavipes]
MSSRLSAIEDSPLDVRLIDDESVGAQTFSHWHGKRRAWFLPDDRHTASLVELRGVWRHARTKLCTRSYGSNAAVAG